MHIFKVFPTEELYAVQNELRTKFNLNIKIGALIMNVDMARKKAQNLPAQ